jgi:hypothetical protein
MFMFVLSRMSVFVLSRMPVFVLSRMLVFAAAWRYPLLSTTNATAGHPCHSGIPWCIKYYSKIRGTSILPEYTLS